MIKKLVIENFKNFEKLNLKLNPLNVLIGANSTGKTNFIRLLSLFKFGATSQWIDRVNGMGGYQSFSHNYNGKPVKIDIELNTIENMLRTDNNKVYTTIEDVFYKYIIDLKGLAFKGIKSEILYRNGRIVLSSDEKFFLDTSNKKFDFDFENQENSSKEFHLDKNELLVTQINEHIRVFSGLLGYFKSFRFYKEFDVNLASDMRKVQMVKNTIDLNIRGTNLTNVLHTIYSDYSTMWDQIENVLKSTFKDFKRLVFSSTSGDGQIDLKWEAKNKSPISSYFLSDGQLKLLCLLAILYNPTNNSVIYIDEPELYLHPYLHVVVGELIKEASNRNQLFVATHSPQLLNALQPEDILILNSSNGLSTTTIDTLVDKEHITKWLEDYNLGELWGMGEIGGKS